MIFLTWYQRKCDCIADDVESLQQGGTVYLATRVGRAAAHLAS
jgi:hypothetical protein